MAAAGLEDEEELGGRPTHPAPGAKMRYCTMDMHPRGGSAAPPLGVAGAEALRGLRDRQNGDEDCFRPMLVARRGGWMDGGGIEKKKKMD
jgi:hypothetical protein